MSRPEAPAFSMCAVKNLLRHWLIEQPTLFYLSGIIGLIGAIQYAQDHVAQAATEPLLVQQVSNQFMALLSW